MQHPIHDSFILHDDQMQLICALPDAEAGTLMKEIIAAHNAQNEEKEYKPTMIDGFSLAVYGIIRKQHIYEHERWLRRKEINRNNAKNLAKEALQKTEEKSE